MDLAKDDMDAVGDRDILDEGDLTPDRIPMLIGLTQQNQMPILPQTLIPTQVMSRSM